MSQKLYELIASTVQARANCIKSGNVDWQHTHEATLSQIERDLLPSGSGFDSGTAIELTACSEIRLVFDTAFHHMNDVGFYDGWTSHSVVVYPTLIGGFSVRITGRDKRDIKDYIAEVFVETLNQLVSWDSNNECWKFNTWAVVADKHLVV